MGYDVAMPQPTRPFLADLGPAELVEGVFAIQNCQIAQTKTGKPYIKCLLGDRTGKLPARKWSTTEQEFRLLPTDGFVYAEGQSQAYQGELQLVLTRIEAHEPTESELKDLLPCTTFDIDTMFSQVVQLLNSMDNPACRCLADRYLEDGSLMERFCQAPAAQSLHHAFLGGLLEHTLSLMQCAERLLPQYPQLNRDIVLMGLFLHDLGKCDELTWKTGFGYSDDGQLVGHIGRGVTMLAHKAELCKDPELGDAAMTLPTAIHRVLEHIILSHHGTPEFGALKIPSTPEAIFVSNLDNLDAKMNMALAAADRSGRGTAQAIEESGGAFTEKIWALNTRLYRPDPTTIPNA